VLLLAGVGGTWPAAACAAADAACSASAAPGLRCSVAIRAFTSACCCCASPPAEVIADAGCMSCLGACVMLLLLMLLQLSLHEHMLQRPEGQTM